MLYFINNLQVSLALLIVKLDENNVMFQVFVQFGMNIVGFVRVR